MCLCVIDKLSLSGLWSDDSNARRPVVLYKIFTPRRACISFYLHKETLDMTHRLTESNSTAVNSHALVAVDRFLLQVFLRVFHADNDDATDEIIFFYSFLSSEAAATANDHLSSFNDGFIIVKWLICLLSAASRKNARRNKKKQHSPSFNFLYFFIKEQHLKLN